jgi:hypothetical protein
MPSKGKTESAAEGKECNNNAGQLICCPKIPPEKTGTNHAVQTEQ